MNLQQINEIICTPVSTLAELSSDSLFRLKNDAADQLAMAKALCEQVDRVLEQRYNTQAQQQRLSVGKDTGVVHFDDGEVRISADLPKRVTWDQKKLDEIAKRIAASGEDPGQYIDISYKVSERKYEAWPDNLKSSFAGARTLKTGKPSFRLALISEVQS
ncbi:hypothetical protein [Marinobacterium sp. xm-a-152]|uniref:hypothetical protein n=1 Tax=Marinobacterium sp. xm-a-152 TaxID=2497733 RepID=UPI0015684795|nr:hypothetical protein [Marinobacterium sp. xm-a-152]NRP14977.1 hypothetical protein [Marinobacterium sp. xm-a-152]